MSVSVEKRGKKKRVFFEQSNGQFVGKRKQTALVFYI